MIMKEVINLEKKLVALVFIALLAGLGGGYGLGYVIYQPQMRAPGGKGLGDDIWSLITQLC